VLKFKRKFRRQSVNDWKNPVHLSSGTGFCGTWWHSYLKPMKTRNCPWKSVTNATCTYVPPAAAPCPPCAHLFNCGDDAVSVLSELAASKAQCNFYSPRVWRPTLNFVPSRHPSGWYTTSQTFNPANWRSWWTMVALKVAISATPATSFISILYSNTS